MYLGIILIYGCACVIIQVRAHLCTCVTASLSNSDDSLTALFTVFRPDCFPQILINYGRCDVGADESENTTTKVMC
jgi:hypothetical protein